MTSSPGHPLETVLDWAPGVLWEYDPAHAVFTYVSDNAEALLEFSAHEWLSPRFWEERLHPEDREAAVAACVHAFEKGQPHTLEYRLLSRSGREVFVIDQARVARDGGRALLRGVMLDVTALAPAGEQQAQVRDTLRAALESFHGVFAVLGPGGEVERLVGSGAFEASSLEQLLGELTLEDRAAIAAALGGEPRSYERQSRDGQRLSISVRPLSGRSRRRGGALLTARPPHHDPDLLTRHMVSDRLATLGALAAAIAHEIRNPLAYATASISFLDAELRVLQKGPRSAPQNLSELLAAVAEVRDGIEHIRQVSAGLTGYARCADDAPCDVAQVAARAIRFVSPSLQGAAVEVELPGGLRAGISAGRLQQVLVNLLINAHQAGASVIRLQASADANSSLLCITVDDDGPGIPPAVLPRIFDRFFTTKPVGIGTGLGLSISRELVQDAGGTLTAENLTPGARFRIELPRRA